MGPDRYSWFMMNFNARKALHNFDVMERAYREFSAKGKPVSPPRAFAAMDVTDHTCRPVITSNCPMEYIRTDPHWQDHDFQEVTREDLAKWAEGMPELQAKGIVTMGGRDVEL